MYIELFSIVYQKIWECTDATVTGGDVTALLTVLSVLGSHRQSLYTDLIFGTSRTKLNFYCG